MKRNPLLAVVLAAGCSSPIVVPPLTPPTTTTVPGALTQGPQAAASPVAMSEAPVGLATSAGKVWVAVGAGALALGDSGLTQVPVGAPGEDMSTGAVRGVFPRGSGLFVSSEKGLFHDAQGRLLRSPVTDALMGATIQALDSFGSGAREELWLTTDRGLLLVKDNALDAVAVTFKEKPLTVVAAIGVASGAALVFSDGGDVFEVDAVKGEAKWVATAVGTVAELARTEDGTVYAATSTGLWRRTGAGAVAQLTLAAEGAQPLPVSAVRAIAGQLLVATGGQVARLSGTGFVGFGAAASVKARGLALDAKGDTFFTDGATLTRLATAKGIGFETDVKPFIVAHCMTCHQTGTNNAPIINLADYPTAVSYADRIKIRLTADGTTPMPPVDTEILTSQQYAAVLQWIAQGTQP